MSEFRVCFFGDSISFGQDESMCDTWVCEIARKLKIFGNERGVKIIVQNPSINGNTTRMALERMAHDVTSRKVDVLVVQFGLNDCNYWDTDMGNPRVSRNSFEANLEEIIIRATTICGVKKIILNTNHISNKNIQIKNTDITYQESNEAYNGIIRKVADAYEDVVILNDIEAYQKEEFETKSLDYSWILADGIHLSTKGHEFYARKTWTIIEAAVSKLV